MKKLLLLLFTFVFFTIAHAQLYKPVNVQAQKLINYNTHKSFSGASGKDSLSVPDIEYIDSLARKAIGDTMSVRSSPILFAKNDLTAQTAGVTITTYAVAGSGSFNTFQVGAYLTVTAVSLDIIQTSITYTDETSTSRSTIFFSMGTTTAGLSTTGVSSYSPVQIRVKQGTTITVLTTLTTSTGSITYDAGASITRLY